MDLDIELQMLNKMMKAEGIEHEQKMVGAI